jgi:hypothetical protein
MGHTHGRITEIRLHPGGQVEAFITCPPVAIPLPGQYLLAADPGDPEAALASPLFLAQKSAHGFWVAPTIPALW